MSSENPAASISPPLGAATGKEPAASASTDPSAPAQAAPAESASTAQAATPASPPAPASTAPTSAETQAREVVYEVNLEIDPLVVDRYDAWLPGHIERILKLPGFLGAETLRREPVDGGERSGWQRRTVQYRLASERDLQNYLDQHAARMRAEAVELFGDRFRAERRVLSQVTRHDVAAAPATVCRNCGSPAPGQYCPVCGQRTPVRVLTVWELLKEATEDITHSDSRLWRTVVPLLLKPGELTREYLLGRRARYLPPFRLYLVLSVLCFLTLGLESTDESMAQAEADIRAELPGMNAEERAAAEKTLQQLETMRKSGTPVSQAVQGATGDSAFEMDCGSVKSDAPILETALGNLCRKLKAPGGPQLFMQELGDNIPKMMFVFLPLIAFVSWLLHAFSGRYYVEHLLLFVHFHAFAFLALTIQSLVAWSGHWLKVLDVVADLLAFVLVFYFPIYLYKAIRRVFGQGRWLVIPKFLLLSIAYVACLAITFVGLVVYTGWMF